MMRNARQAFQALDRIGAPVYDRQEYGAEFILGGELRDSEDSYYADYWQEEVKEHIGSAPESESHPFRFKDGRVVRNAFGIREDVHKILRQYGLRAEWIDGGTVGIYQD